MPSSPEGQARPGQAPPGPGDVVVLPDGGLLYVDATPWQLLAPGAGSWCAVRAVGRKWPCRGPGGGNGQTVMPMSFAVVDSSLWWLSTSSTSTAPATVTAHDVGVASLTCTR